MWWGRLRERGFLCARARDAEPRDGDLLAVMSAGAYGFVMASNYNSRPARPGDNCRRAEAHLVRERESFDDLGARRKNCRPAAGRTLLMAKLGFTKMHGAAMTKFISPPTACARRPRRTFPRLSDRRFGTAATGHHARAFEKRPTCGWRCITPTAAAGEMAAMESLRRRLHTSAPRGRAIRWSSSPTADSDRGTEA